MRSGGVATDVHGPEAGPWEEHFVFCFASIHVPCNKERNSILEEESGRKNFHQM